MQEHMDVFGPWSISMWVREFLFFEKGLLKTEMQDFKIIKSYLGEEENTQREIVIVDLWLKSVSAEATKV